MKSVNIPTVKRITWRDTAAAYFQKYRHGLLLLYFLIYLPWFQWLEDTVTSRVHEIHMSIDDSIPFIEYFIVPYLLWFFYIAAAILYFLLKNKNEYYRLCTFLFIGMTVFLIISTVYPNGHYLRPDKFERDNIFVDMVKCLYCADTPTNLFPSIHVYNSIGVNIAVWHSEDFRQNNFIRFGSLILMVSIILSTVFLKQHSVFDVITGIVFSAFMYTMIYSISGLLAGNSKHPVENLVRRV